MDRLGLMFLLWLFIICLMIYKSIKFIYFGFFKLLFFGIVLCFDYVIMVVMLDDLMNMWLVVVLVVMDLGVWYLIIFVKMKVKVKVI